MENKRFRGAARRRRITAVMVTALFHVGLIYGLMSATDENSTWADILPDTVKEWVQGEEAPQKEEAVQVKRKGA